jgi:CheY-like chemotaxis protein
MTEFILMLTRDDVTVSNARELLEQVLQTSTQHIGFKDVGLPFEQMLDLTRTIRTAGRTSHLEVVSLTEEDELKSARVALDLGIDYLIGGSRWRQVSSLIKGHNVKYFPYVGEIIGHPAQLGGDLERLVREAAEIGDVADGINLLAFRHVDLDGLALLRDFASRVKKPVICAGSIDSTQRIAEVGAAGAWAFTVGKAALDGRFAADPTLTTQLNTILAAAA